MLAFGDIGKCKDCGKLVSLNNPNIKIIFIPDSEYTKEKTEYLCVKCK